MIGTITGHYVIRRRMKAALNLRSDPIPALIRRLAIPASMGMLFSVLLSVVDTFYAGMLSPTALAALSLAGPVFFLMLTLGIGAGQACNALVGNRLGAEQPLQARKLALQCLSFAALVSIAASIVAFVMAPSIFTAMGGEDPYLQPSIRYMRVVLIGTAFFSLAIVQNSILNTKGDTHSYRNAQMYALAANIVLDPLFMFVMGMGVTGVAVASIIVQMGVVIYLAGKIRKLDFMQKPHPCEYIPNITSYREIIQQALPSTVSMLLVALGSVIIVAFVSRFGEASMAAYGIALRIEQIVLLLVIGLNIAAISITSVNYGARQLDRVSQVYRTGLRYAMTLMVPGGLLLFFFGHYFMSLFTPDAEVQAIGTVYLRFEAFILPAFALTFLSAAVLQGLKQPHVPLYFNFVRQVLAQLIMFYMVVYVLKLDIRGVWGSILLINWVLGLGIVYVTQKRIKQITVAAGLPGTERY